MDLDDAADDLYALPPDEFTAARKAKATEARRAGDRQLAKTIGELRRPTVSAAIINQLTRGHPELIDGLLTLADEMRQAQVALAGEDLRQLSARRNEVVSALVEEGRRLAAEQQHPLTASGESEMTATMQAALADPDAAEAVRSGRLTSALQYSGFGMASDVVQAQPLKRRTERPAPPPRAAAAPHDAQEAHRKEVAVATAALTAAQSRLDEVAEVASRADKAVADTQRRRREAAERIAELERQLAQARDDERQAAREVRAMEKDRDRAARLVQAARRRVEQAEQTLSE